MLSEVHVVVHEPIGQSGEKLRRLVLKGPIAQYAKAGQFVAVRVQDPVLSSWDPLLRRPISVAEISSEREEITLLYRVVGKGTEILARVGCGETLSVMGPLGNGFSLPEAGELWLVAGGIGIFPLYSLAKSALARGLSVRLFWGGDHQSFLTSAGLASWQALGIPIHLCTMDGSLGEKGLVTIPVREHLSKLRERMAVAGEVQVATCGPQKMMQAVTELCMNFGIPVEVSLEERMGCAVGACLGCVCTLVDKTGVQVHKKVCLDGPVFRGEEVVWDASC